MPPPPRRESERTGEWGAGRRESEQREKERRSTAPTLSYTLSTYAGARERSHTPERAPPLHSLSATPPAPPAPVARGEDKRARPQLLLWERESGEMRTPTDA
ncbi:hypothetical protein HPB50_000949 [Hyalomma asiaticum]|uniref:Uncharacterized protein n=1 Tax=Hyalomma asiaticum TaxID=266040 RepID=A0ACB7T7H4_HYAAI|nr:hypothetical protein HPB50_000949 [Hyalomma asiaticum]